ncbi:hypothetical protein GCM10009665_36780 [Kitasatospora nipponensis]|uniref:HTH hxlR-type domain-containing protein n=1 Tax=Kitasatospora nipponensis TaxID=258049 RepID=A0ABN1WCN9_9ACTN
MSESIFAPAPPAPLPPDLFDPSFSELKVPLRGITPKVLAQSLRALERDGLLTRTEFEENPPRVEYELTALGRSPFGPMNVACAWAREYLGQLAAAREAHLAAGVQPVSSRASR